MTEPRRFPAGLTLAALSGVIILLSLGVWQVQRLQWKRDLLARVAALEAAPPRPAAAVLAQGGDLDFVRVSATCPGLAAAPFLELYAVREGRAGTRLISACRLEAGPYRSLLVDRGFVADDVSARPPVDAADSRPAPVVGVLRVPDPPTIVTPANQPAANRWYSRDVAAMARALDAPAPAPVVLYAETSANPDWKALAPAPLPAHIPNRHLEYALTWFGLAGALIAVYAAMLWRRWKA